MNFKVRPPVPHSLTFPSHLAVALAARGAVTDSAARELLSTPPLLDPYLFTEMPLAVSLIREAVRTRRRIALFGDYDVDGVSGTSILLLALRTLKCEPVVHIPSRRHGYGLSARALSSLKADLVISIDCGVAHTLTPPCPLIITDHHEPRVTHSGEVSPTTPPPSGGGGAGGVIRPQCDAILHPHWGYPFPHICGAGVAYKLATSLLNGRTTSDLQALVGLGTVADVVPLLGENRTLVRQSLASLPGSSLPGVQALLASANLTNRVLTAADIGFQLGPRINSAGRLACALPMVELLTTTSPARARALANECDRLNALRKRLSARVADEALSQVPDPLPPGLVLYSPAWNHGVTGIAAGRVAEKTNRPVVLLSGDPRLAGSARSNGVVPLHTVVEKCRDLLLSGGGHSEAAGVSLSRDNLDLFRDRFALACSAYPLPSPRLPEAVGVALPSSWTLADVESIALLGPFGKLAPEPLFATPPLSPVSLRRMGNPPDHLSFALDGVRCVFFSAAKRLPFPDGPLSFLYRPVVNEWRGRRSVELQIVDFQPG